MKFKTFGERLNWARRNHARITQKELCERMERDHGVSIGANYISELETENAKKRPSLEVVSAMAKVLDISIDWLAGHTENLTATTPDDEPATYYSPEADQVAQLVDTMRPDQRAILVNLARNMAVLSTERQRRQAEAREILESVERNLGKEARAEVERIFRSRGLLANGPGGGDDTGV